MHVVGTNGKSTTTRTIEETLLREGLRVGRLHLAARVAAGRERIRVDGQEAELERTLSRGCRPRSMAVGATQFEVLTAAALLAFAEAEVEVAAVEAGLGGRLDATNVLRSPVAGADERRARAHRGARLDARGDRRGEARRRPAGRHGRARRARVGGAGAAERRAAGSSSRRAATSARGRRGERVPRPPRGTGAGAAPGPARPARRATRSGTARTRRRRSGYIAPQLPGARLDRRLRARGQGRRRRCSRELAGHGFRPRRDDLVEPAGALCRETCGVRAPTFRPRRGRERSRARRSRARTSWGAGARDRLAVPARGPVVRRAPRLSSQRLPLRLRSRSRRFSDWRLRRGT